MDGAPYTWEPDAMVFWSNGARKQDASAVAAERERVHFQLAEGEPVARRGESLAKVGA